MTQLHAVHEVNSSTKIRVELFQVKATKTRTLPLRTHVRHEGVKSKTFPFLDFDVKDVGSLSGTQTTESEGHPFYLLKDKRINGDIGGEFLTERLFYSDNCKRVKVWSGPVDDSAYFDGTLFPYLSSSPTPIGGQWPLDPSSDSALDALGTTAISRVLPTNPVAGLATALGELREGFPKVIGSSLFREMGRPPKKKLGEEYLNYQFGWAPMVSDFQKWLKAFRTADRIWKQFQRDAGKRVRRRYTFPETTEVLLDDALQDQPVANGSVNGLLWQGSNLQTLYRNITVSRKQWFSGAFTYYLEDNSSTVTHWDRDLQRLDKLYGVRITPEVIWNLAPWSWAADWFGNMGDVIHNTSRFAADGLVMPYGYMMEHSVLRATYRMRNVTPKGAYIPDLTQVFTKVVKKRRKATPFGFGLDFDSFSQFQLSIIAALGLSRTR